MMTASSSDSIDTPHLSSLLAGIAEVALEDDRAVFGLTIDSRRVRPGDVFFACRGTQVDGHAFIADAVHYGAVAVLCESLPEQLSLLSVRVPMLAIPDLAKKIGMIAERFYHYPTRDMFVVGVTGTNGKTSTTHFLAHGLSKGVTTPCGLIGTLGSGVYGNLNPGLHTTPDPVTLHRLLAEFHDAGARDAVMEVSSHGLDQGRVAGVEYSAAVFTNLTRDHLDYHGTMEKYAQAKRRLFRCATLRWVIVNADDVGSGTIVAEASPGAQIIGFSLGNARVSSARAIKYVYGRIQRSDITGMGLAITGDYGAAVLHTQLIGEFNASNLLAALCVLLSRGVLMDEAAARLSTVRPVPGRLETFGGNKGRPLVVVDYAHTPDALEKVLAALRPLCRGKLWLVFGCGGNRDRGKRSQMGAIAERHSDYCVLTDDNPRHEDPTAITADILDGMKAPSSVNVIHSRSDAIAFAVKQAGLDDVVLIAGKGHEDYQEIQAQRRPFSDRQYVTGLMS